MVCEHSLQRTLLDASIESSLCSIGDSYDNALAEIINRLFKVELIQRRGFRKSTDDVEWVTLEWVSWFNNQRLTYILLSRIWGKLLSVT